MDKPRDKKDQPEYKMGGPRGVLLFAAFFTSYTYYVTLKCQTGSWDMLAIPPTPGSMTSLLDIKVTLFVLCWFLAQCVLYTMPVGGSLEAGVKLQSGVQLSYRANALFVLAVNVGGLLVACAIGYDVTSMNNALLQMLTSAVALCLVFSVYLYIRGRNAIPQDRNPSADTGHVVYDWFMGRELNPRWRSLDVKYVLFRSGIIGWILLNMCNLLENSARNQPFNGSLVALSVMQLGYVADYFYYERGVIVSRDIVSEGLGYNILVQFVMIPFCFCMQTRYVLTTNYSCDAASLAIILITYASGFYIYRASNSEKNNFRKNPDDPKLAHLKVMKTSQGKSLLISGWWGRCRHPNYLGDLIISLSYGVCTGCGHVLPYMGSLFLLLLLLDREKMDNDDCKKKYGDDWHKYCTIVKYKIVPGIY